MTLPRHLFWVGLFSLISSATASVAATVAIGEQHICAVSNNILNCWGSNSSGQLGNGQSAVPVNFQPFEAKLDPADKVLAVAAGVKHSCALLKGGAVKCWGDNFSGQLGLGSDLLGKTVTLPQVVPDLGNVTDIATGGLHTCALRTNGVVWCWGYNNHGQAGSDPSQKDIPSPVQVGGVSNAKAVFAGISHTCVLTQDGKAWCWGDNGQGQLGTGVQAKDGNNDANPQPQPVALGEPVSALALGKYFTCALLQGGSVKCWGGNSFGELGNGGKYLSLTPVDVSGLSAVTAIAAGDTHACALRNNGTVWCWGNAPIYEQKPTIYDGLVANSRVPVEVKPPYITNVYGEPAKAVAAGGYNVCLAVVEMLTCWGRGEEGELMVDPNSLLLKKDQGMSIHYGWLGYVKTYLNFVTLSAAYCAPDEEWNAAKQHCGPKMVVADAPAPEQGQPGDGSMGPVAAVMAKWGPDIYKLHHDLSKAVLALADAGNDFSSQLETAIEPKIVELAKQASQPKWNSLWSQGTGGIGVGGDKAAQMKISPQAEIQKELEAKQKAMMAAGSSKSSGGLDAAKNYQEASDNLQVIFTELNNDLAAVLETPSGTSGFDAKAFKTYREAVAVYISAFFALAAKQELNQPSSFCSGKPIGDELLYKYLLKYDREGKEAEAKLALKTLVETLQCAPKKFAFLANKSLYSAFNTAMQVVKATQPAYFVPMRDYFLTVLWPVATPLVDRTKDRVLAGPAILLMEQYAKRLNDLGATAMTDGFGISLQPKWVFLFNPDSKQMEELKSCPWPAPPFATPLPATTEGSGPKTPLGVTDAQIEQSICPWKTPIWPVWDGNTPCISLRNFARVAVNPVALGYLTCPYWYTARVGKGCDHKVCGKKTGWLEEGFQRVVRAVRAAGSALIPDASAQMRATAPFSAAAYIANMSDKDKRIQMTIALSKTIVSGKVESVQTRLVTVLGKGNAPLYSRVVTDVTLKVLEVYKGEAKTTSILFSVPGGCDAKSGACTHTGYPAFSKDESVTVFLVRDAKGAYWLTPGTFSKQNLVKGRLVGSAPPPASPKMNAPFVPEGMDIDQADLKKRIGPPAGAGQGGRGGRP